MSLRLSTWVFALVGVLVTQVAAADRKMVRIAETMGTTVALTVWGDDEAKTAAAAKAVFDEFDRVNRLMSSWLKESDVARINAAAGKAWIKVDPEVFKVIARSQQMAKTSGGAFDTTVGAFRGLWKFDEDIDFTVPKQSELEARQKLVGYKGLLLRPKTQKVRLRRKGMRITLGGIAKGYAVDRAVSALHQMDVLDFILQAGGDLYVSGKKGAEPWKVGIRDPRGDRQSSFAVIALEDHTFSTSGDYERGFVKDGVRYHHILDPTTAQPARKSRSVTVLAKDAITADTWSTALFVMGVERGLPLVEANPQIEAVFVDAVNKVHISSGLKNKLKVFKQPSSGP